MDQTIDYIIRFLLRENESLAHRVGYTTNRASFSKYDVVIVPSPFFFDGIYGTPESEPQLPLSRIKGTPFLFGEPTIEKVDETIVVHADIIASTYFLISRYEEFLHQTEHRDAHGRFIGKESLPYRAGFLHRPVIDEYSQLLIGWLSEKGHAVKHAANGFQKIYLTHDVDTISYYRHLRGFLGGIKRNITSPQRLKQVFRSLFQLKYDPAFTFPWIMEQDALIEKAETVYFFKSAVHPHRLDRPSYPLNGKDTQRLCRMIQNMGGTIGLHTSYASGEKPQEITQEKQRLEEALHTRVCYNRWHFLRTLQPSDFLQLEEAQLNDDFTMGYADVVGFRIGTCRAVQWINPQTQEVTSLTLHPLTVMDCTLSNDNYMHLSEEKAWQTVQQLLKEIKTHNGEVVLLWHNTIFSTIETNYHRSLYKKIINELKA